VSLCSVAARADDAPSATAWAVQGEWLVNRVHRCQLQKPTDGDWAFEQDASGAWRIVHRTHDATIIVTCDVRTTTARVQSLAEAVIAAAYQPSEDQFLLQARTLRRSATFQGLRAVQVDIAGPCARGTSRTEHYLLFKRGPATVTFRATASPREAYDAQREAINAILHSLTWF